MNYKDCEQSLKLSQNGMRSFGKPTLYQSYDEESVELRDPRTGATEVALARSNQE